MKKLSHWVGLCLTVAVCAASAQTALPMRNVQIEVRQVLSQDSQRAGVEGAARVQVERNGQVGVAGQLQLQQRQTTQSNSVGQYALVLNGRSTRIALGSSTPLRVWQSYLRNGAPVYIQGTVMVDTGSGFWATPRWDGGQWVELEIAAQQMNASVSSTLVLPLNEWTTIAQSDQNMVGSSAGLGGSSNQSGHTASDVQVRLTIR
jgi:hypothetical protein